MALHQYSQDTAAIGKDKGKMEKRPLTLFCFSFPFPLSLSISFTSGPPTCCPQRLQPSLQSHISVFLRERSRPCHSQNTDVKHLIISALRGRCLGHTDHGLHCTPGNRPSQRACLSVLRSVLSMLRDLGAFQDDRDAEAGCILSQ